MPAEIVHIYHIRASDLVLPPWLGAVIILAEVAGLIGLFLFLRRR